jgi:hypothetical protein
VGDLRRLDAAGEVRGALSDDRAWQDFWFLAEAGRKYVILLEADEQEYVVLSLSAGASAWEQYGRTADRRLKWRAGEGGMFVVNVSRGNYGSTALDYRLRITDVTPGDAEDLGEDDGWSDLDDLELDDADEPERAEPEAEPEGVADAGAAESWWDEAWDAEWDDESDDADEEWADEEDQFEFAWIDVGDNDEEELEWQAGEDEPW